MTKPRKFELPAGATTGFCGKLPCRGDFVTAGLPRRFVEPWHDWMQRVLAASRELLGEEWLPAWLEAPIWHFALDGGVCGPDAVVGVWMPSVDRIGRHFPLTLAAVVPESEVADLLSGAGGFLAAIECAGLDALAHDIEPEPLTGRIEAAATTPRIAAENGITGSEADSARWWTAGAPRVPRSAFATTTLPEAGVFAGMLDASAVVAEACR